MNKTNAITVLALVAVLVVGFGSSVKAQLSEWMGVNISSENTYLAFDAPDVPAVENTIGGLAGPDIPSTYLKWGGGHGVRLYPTSYPLKTATTTVCSIQSPLATSTLVSGGILFTTSTTTASTGAIGKASNPTATTSVLNTWSLAANEQGLFSASTTAQIGASAVFAPSEFLNFTMAGNVGGTTFSPVGSCHATFEEYISH